MTLRTGIALLVIGAILAFAIRSSIPGVDLTMVGYILMAGGLVALVAGLFVGQNSYYQRRWGGPTAPPPDDLP